MSDVRPAEASAPRPSRSAFSVVRNLGQLVRPRAGDYPAVTGLRAFGVLWVIAFHTVFFLGMFEPRELYARAAADPWLAPFWHGSLGVDVFFVVSGFLIADILMTEHERDGRVKLGRFYLRRFLRLMPAYLLAMGLFLITPAPNKGSVWANLLYVNNFLPQRDQFMPHTWSLAIEEQFYLVFPFALGLLYRTNERARRGWLVAFFVASCALAAALALVFRIALPTFDGFGDLEHFGAYFDVLYDKPWGRFGALALGVLVAHVRRAPGGVAWAERHRALGWLGTALAAVALVLVVAVRDTSLDLDLTRPADAGYTAATALWLALHRYLFALAIAWLVYLSLTEHPVGRGLRKVLGARVLHPIAQLSYSAYLVNPLVVIVFYFPMQPSVAGASGSLLGLFAGVLVLNFVLATIVYLAVEAPFMNLRPGSHPVPKGAGAP